VHPFYEEGVGAFQDTVRRILDAHTQREEKEGRRIAPAVREQQGRCGDSVETSILRCAELYNKDLSW